MISKELKNRKLAMQKWTDKDLQYILNMSSAGFHLKLNVRAYSASVNHDGDNCMWCLCKAEMERRKLETEPISIVELMKYLEEKMK